MKKIIFILYLLSNFINNTYCQQHFDRVYGENLNESGQTVEKENDSTLVLLGWQQSNTFYFVKCNLQGDTILSKSINLIGNTFGIDLIKLPQNEYILIGDRGGLVKIDSLGNIIWSKPISDCTLKSGTLLNDSTFSVTGGFPIFSHIDSFPIIDSIFYEDILIRNYDFNGNLLKDTTYSFITGDIEMGNSIIRTSDNGMLLTGFSYLNGNPNLFVLKIDSLWNTLIDTLYSYNGIYVGNEISENNSKDIFITGEKWINAIDDKNIIIQKMDSQGNIIWENNYDFLSIERGMSLTISSSGYYYIFGETSNGLNGPAQVRNLVLIKVDSSGNTFYTKLINNAGRKMAQSIIEVNNSTLAMFGLTDYNTRGGTDMYLILSDTLGGFTATVGVDQNIRNSIYLHIFPNPTSTHFIIKDLKKPFSLAIYNAVGQLLYQENDINEQNKKVDISQFSRGILFVEIEVEGEIIYRKVLKQ